MWAGGGRRRQEVRRRVLYFGVRGGCSTGCRNDYICIFIGGEIRSGNLELLWKRTHFNVTENIVEDRVKGGREVGWGAGEKLLQGK